MTTVKDFIDSILSMPGMTQLTCDVPHMSFFELVQHGPDRPLVTIRFYVSADGRVAMSARNDEGLSNDSFLLSGVFNLSSIVLLPTESAGLVYRNYSLPEFISHVRFPFDETNSYVSSHNLAKHMVGLNHILSLARGGELPFELTTEDSDMHCDTVLSTYVNKESWEAVEVALAVALDIPRYEFDASWLSVTHHSVLVGESINADDPGQFNEFRVISDPLMYRLYMPYLLSKCGLVANVRENEHGFCAQVARSKGISECSVFISAPTEAQAIGLAVLLAMPDKKIRSKMIRFSSEREWLNTFWKETTGDA